MQILQKKFLLFLIVHADGHMVKGKGKRAEMEGFKASPTAPYDWNADKAQRTIMMKIKAKRPDAIFEAFSNSAPYWMTFSGCSAGNDDPLKDNLKPEYYDMKGTDNQNAISFECGNHFIRIKLFFFRIKLLPHPNVLEIAFE